MKHVKPLIELDLVLDYQTPRPNPSPLAKAKEWLEDVYECTNRWQLTILIGVVVLVAGWSADVTTSWLLDLLGRLLLLVGAIGWRLQDAGLLDD